MGLFTTIRDRLRSPARGVAGFRREALPFDAPPEEPVELDESALPWELRDDPPEP